MKQYRIPEILSDVKEDLENKGIILSKGKIKKIIDMK